MRVLIDIIKIHVSTSIPELSKFQATIKPIVPSQVKLDLAERTIHFNKIFTTSGATLARTLSISGLKY